MSKTTQRHGSTRLRADAQRNVDRIRAAASEAFCLHGLDASLEDIARTAGVSVGTIYNRFGSREGLLDSVVADVAQAKLDTAVAAVDPSAESWERFSSYVFALGRNQAEDPAFNGVVSRRYPAAERLREVCDRAVSYGTELMQEAQRDGRLRADATADDLDRLIWLNAQAVRLGGEWWRRALGIFMDGLAT